MLTTFQGLIALLAAVDALSHVDGLGDISKQVLARCSMDFFSFSFQFLVCIGLGKPFLVRNGFRAI